MNRQPILNADLADIPACNVLPVHAIWSIWRVQRNPGENWLFLLAPREQVSHPDAQGLGQEKCFLVGDAADASLNLGQSSPGDIQADPLASGGELLLGDVEPISQPADLFSYDVRGQVVLHLWSLTLMHYWI